MPADELTQPAGDHVDPIAILASGEVEVLGRMPWSSNATAPLTIGAVQLCPGDAHRLTFLFGELERLVQSERTALGLLRGQ